MYRGEQSASNVVEAQLNELAKVMYGSPHQMAFPAGRDCVTDGLSGLLSGLPTERLTKEEFVRIEGSTE